MCVCICICMCECVKVCRAYGCLPLLGGVRRIGRHLRTGCGVGVEAPVAALQGVRHFPQLSTHCLLKSISVYFKCIPAYFSLTPQSIFQVAMVVMVSNMYRVHVLSVHFPSLLSSSSPFFPLLSPSSPLLPRYGFDVQSGFTADDIHAQIDTITDFEVRLLVK